MILLLIVSIALSFLCTSLPLTLPQDRFIVGGYDANITQYPHHVYLVPFEGAFVQLDHCGASVISRRWVSAAHCVVDIATSAKLLMGISNDWEEGHLMEIQLMITHPGYRVYGEISKFDISLLKTYEEIPFNDRVQPILLANEADDQVTTQLVATGFGRPSYETYGSFRLKEVNLSRMDVFECSKNDEGSVRDLMRWPNLAEKFICVVDSTGGRSHPYKGDSGGPLIGYSSVRNATVLVGVASRMAANHRVFYTGLSSLQDWIFEVIRRYEYTENEGWFVATTISSI